MHKLLMTAAGFTLLAGLTAGALAQEKPRSVNAQAGRELATHNCDACHIVSPNQDLRPLVTGYAPSFSDIANRPNSTAGSLRIFLSRAHGYSNMPYPDLEPADRDNVIAYIMSLRGRR